MARELQKLSFKAVEKRSKPGYYADGGGLYLQIGPSGSKSWLFRYILNRKRREMGLGSVFAVALAEAREKAADCRRLLAHRVDPIEARDRVRAREALETAKAIAFSECAGADMDQKPATAGRVRGGIERVLDWPRCAVIATARNPARWRGHLDKLLPSLKKSRRVKHHPALPIRGHWRVHGRVAD
jgi:hypothetical protein